MRALRAHLPGSRLAGEAGFALPTVMFLTLAAFSIATIGVTASINTQRGTTRDLDTKNALAVAEAGSQQALIRYNAAAARGTCVAPQTKQANGWCTPATGSLGNGATFTYWVAPNTTPTDSLQIVSQGIKDGVVRRVYVTADSAAGSKPFVDAGVIGKDAIGLASNAHITGDMATNGNITLANGSNSICGNAQVGVGHDILPAGTTKHQCGAETQGELSLPAVNQGDVRTNNNNSIILAGAGGKKPDGICFNGKTGTGGTGSCGSRELTVGVNSALTIQSGNYSLCKLTTSSNSNIFIAANAIVRIYFDSPEACGYTNVNGASIQQLALSSNGGISVNAGGSSTDFAMLFVGSDTRATSISLSSNTDGNPTCSQNFVVYAPRTDISFASNTSYCGAIAGKTIDLSANTNITANNLATQFDLPNAPAHYSVSRFVECAAVQSSTPTCS